MTPESRLQRKIHEALEDEFGGLWFKVHGGPYQMAGISDIIGCLPNGRFVALEVKIPGAEDTLTKLQEKFIKNTLKNNGISGMVTSVAQAKKLIRDNIQGS